MSALDSLKARFRSDSKKRRSDANYAVAFGVAVVSDLIDYGVGSIPFLGDILDAVTVPILYRLIGPISLTGLIEFIPGLDIIPTHTIAVVISWLRRGRKA